MTMVFITQEMCALTKVELSTHTCAFCFANIHSSMKPNLVVYGKTIKMSLVAFFSVTLFFLLIFYNSFSS